MAIVLILILVIWLGYAFFTLRQKKYRKFISSHSVSIKKLLEINSTYDFYPCTRYDDWHMYDNETFYDNVSCLNYLTYQLQFNQYKVLDEIRNAEKNKKKYADYINEVNLINTFGEFDVPHKKSNSKHFLSLERKIFNENKLTPCVNYDITITLYRTNINGKIYNSKEETFNSEQILLLIKKLNNKNRAFFNDRDIWDALCRVERAKVSNKMRFSIYARDGYRCQICGKSGAFSNLEIDHIKPIAKGGKTTYDNLQTLCRRCNVRKGDSY